MNEIWALVLAAGESKRMKVPKMLLPFGRETMIEKVIGNIAGSKVDRTLLVLGSYKEEIQSVADKYPVLTCYNINYKDGMFSSVKCGFGNLTEKVKAVMIFPGDQPFIEAGIINRVIDAYKKSGKGIVIPVYKKKRGHPLLIDCKYRNMVINANPDEGLRWLAYEYPEDVFEVRTNSPDILRDFNTKEDYLNAINQNS
jgi:molybdenum cofactor cytidylyltransferase